LGKRVETKADIQQLDEIIRILDMKTERQDLEVLRQDISTKVHKHEFEMLGVQLKNF
jgi:hypothetical protein